MPDMPQIQVLRIGSSRNAQIILDRVREHLDAGARGLEVLILTCQMRDFSELYYRARIDPFYRQGWVLSTDRLSSADYDTRIRMVSSSDSRTDLLYGLRVDWVIYDPDIVRADPAIRNRIRAILKPLREQGSTS